MSEHHPANLDVAEVDRQIAELVDRSTSACRNIRLRRRPLSFCFTPAELEVHRSSLDDAVRLPVAGVDGRKMRLWRLCSRGNFGDIVPREKGGIASRAMLVGIEPMTAELEVVVDPTVGGEKALRVTR